MTDPAAAEPDQPEIPESDRPVPAAASRGGVGRASLVIASGTFVSRILGFVNTVLFAQTIGQSTIGADAFRVANGLPNAISVIIATGLLSSVFVPAIVRAEKHADGGQAYINRLVTLGLSGFLGIGIVATVCAPLLVRLYTNGETFTGAALELAIAFGYWCMPQVFFYAMYSLLGEVLNAKRLFGPFTWATLINNVIAIAGLLVFRVVFGVGSAEGPADGWTTGMVVLLAASATLGVASQAFFLTIFWRRAGLKFRPDFRWKGVGLRATGVAASWTFAMVLVNQLAGVVQSNVATVASGAGLASVAVINNAFLLYILPHSIAGWSIASAHFPGMAAAFRDGRMDALRDDFAAAVRSIGLVLVFSTVGFVVLAYCLSAPFSNDGYGEAALMAPVLIAFLVGLVPMSVHFFLRRVFYAVGDTRTPFVITAVQAALFVLGALWVATWPHQWIAVGLAIVTSVTGIIQTLLALALLRRRVGLLRGRRVLRGYVQFVVACVPAVVVGVPLVWLLGGYTPGGFGVSTPLGGIAVAAIAGAVMALVYAGALRLMRNPEITAMAGTALRRIRR